MDFLAYHKVTIVIFYDNVYQLMTKRYDLITVRLKKQTSMYRLIFLRTDYGRPVRKLSSLHGRKSAPTPKFLGTAKAYFVCHIGPNFQVSLNYAFIALCVRSP